MIPKLIDIMFGLSLLRTSLIEMNENLTSYIKLYSRIVENANLKKLLVVLLKINNYLNISTGKRTIPNFDIRSIDNILNLKNNSQYFIDLLVKIYKTNLKGNSILLDSQDSYLLKHITDLNLNLNNLENEYEKARQRIEEYKTSMGLMVKAKAFLEYMDKRYSDMKELMNSLNENIIKEKLLRKDFLVYFGLTCDSKNDGEMVHSIVNAVVSLSKKIGPKLKEIDSAVLKNEPTDCRSNLDKVSVEKVNIKLQMTKLPSESKNIIMTKNLGVANKENKKTLNLINSKYKL
jgi:hypothetical protein